MAEEYPCAPIEGVAPFLIESVLRQTMALRFMQATDCTMDEAVMLATASWETDWESDPSPRTIEHAKQAVDAALEYWIEE